VRKNCTPGSVREPLTCVRVDLADFLDCSYGSRPGRSAHQALAEIRGHLQAGYQAVYDADLKGYFDAIPHGKLGACLRIRIADRSVLSLIWGCLKVAVVEPPATPGGKPHNREKTRVIDLRAKGSRGFKDGRADR